MVGVHREMELHAVSNRDKKIVLTPQILLRRQVPFCSLHASHSRAGGGQKEYRVLQLLPELSASSPPPNPVWQRFPGISPSLPCRSRICWRKVALSPTACWREPWLWGQAASSSTAAWRWAHSLLSLSSPLAPKDTAFLDYLWLVQNEG